MLIAEFARETGLPRETVRFYVRRGLLHPQQGIKGGSRPYQIFGDKDVELARIIRVHQALGSSLSEIGDMIADYTQDADNPDRTRTLLSDHIARLEQQRHEIDGMLAFLRSKLDWMAQQKGPPPKFSDFA
ncbi:MerR family transcriptional regulator [Ketogulonicigenium vulgare]|uniref:Transcriptional regulator, MerR family protein n=1 Tax=Ketogulonicigenium vulgare (strain WSH-001) TaxID=759362 RepID=F9Y8X5_KETVW|nr:MerR family transcriptional regulator [Ketogulonicigenium vulgare]ADO41802.1 transcriptional regulator, MerR family [Ketogulonicigenium vulgare Y25]AEM40031.1 Transcriptional regulator, MerR family protein [Ketogulonicigenium vulgare WSH-001]ALJ80238.1 MerR family transcriptional regulator [Ketogulonicigenium vulgare]ANW33097.1 MerR family transcriptional regulator [Ketogulonicigenium vulgare]AOZ53733.1 transcriptional regulator, MerR family [Ketogulonicigenium vulgare]